ncbi:putative transmembrane protein ORF57 [Intoshia linei]|uniref:Chloride channel CLIC-like protein 1 n=1 Tax=Intoshia linei TaxID=1819745 RepID=A0A177BE84_9BILA|nr:putative transmembrane protein ORF57 [Intoshia linei]
MLLILVLSLLMVCNNKSETINLNPINGENIDIVDTNELIDKELHLNRANRHFKVYLRRMIHLVEKYKSKDSNFRLHVYITEKDLNVLRKYATTKEIKVESKYMKRVHDFLIKMIIHIEQTDQDQEYKNFNYFDDDYSSLNQAVNFCIENSRYIFCTILCIALILYIIQFFLKVNISLYQCILKSTPYVFLLSLPWNAFLLYQTEKAKKLTQISKNKNNFNCGQQNFLKIVSSYFILSEDACLEYNKAILVEPIWEISPNKVLVATITKLIIEPLEHIGVAFRKFFISIFHDIPLTILPISAIFSFFIVIILITIMSDYSISIFGISVTPNTKNHMIHYEMSEIQEKFDTINREILKIQQLHVTDVTDIKPPNQDQDKDVKYDEKRICKN